MKIRPCKLCGKIGHTKFQCFSNPKPRMPGKRPCKFCGDENHSSIVCRTNPRRRLKPQSEKRRTKMNLVKKNWREINQPDDDGYWDCYLGISPFCFGMVDETTLVHEHVVPKAKDPSLIYEVTNLKPACNPCNTLKAGFSLEKIIQTYPESRVAKETLA